MERKEETKSDESLKRNNEEKENINMNNDKQKKEKENGRKKTQLKDDFKLERKIFTLIKSIFPIPMKIKTLGGKEHFVEVTENILNQDNVEKIIYKAEKNAIRKFMIRNAKLRIEPLHFQIIVKCKIMKKFRKLGDYGSSTRFKIMIELLDAMIKEIKLPAVNQEDKELLAKKCKEILNMDNGGYDFSESRPNIIISPMQIIKMEYKALDYSESLANDIEVINLVHIPFFIVRIIQDKNTIALTQSRNLGDYRGAETFINLNSLKQNNDFKHRIREVVPIFKIGQNKVIYISEEAFIESFKEKPRKKILTEIMYVHADLRVVFHEFLIKYFNLDNYIIKFPMQIDEKFIEFCYLGDKIELKTPLIYGEAKYLNGESKIRWSHSALIDPEGDGRLNQYSSVIELPRKKLVDRGVELNELQKEKMEKWIRKRGKFFEIPTEKSEGESVSTNEKEEEDS
jgi:hypothetical protein